MAVPAASSLSGSVLSSLLLTVVGISAAGASDSDRAGAMQLSCLHFLLSGSSVSDMTVGVISILLPSSSLCSSISIGLDFRLLGSGSCAT